MDGIEVLFQSSSAGGLALTNRFAMAPMTRGRSPGGVPTPEVADYYRRRAEGGVGLIITEGVLIGHASAGRELDIPRMVPGPAEEGWRKVVEEVHAGGGKIAAQLWHVGGTRGCDDGTLPWSPSGIDEHGRGIGAAMTMHDIDLIVERFADSARVAQRAGLDAIEIHGAHGYLVDEFLWAATNRRTDRYGGCLEARSRFAAEIAHAIRDVTGREFPIIFRFSQFKERDYSAVIAQSPRELAQVLEPISPYVSLIHASARRAWEPAFRESSTTLAGWAKRLTGLPSIAVGSVGLSTAAALGPASRPDSLLALSDRVGSGEFDLLAIGRPLLGNADWVDLIAKSESHRIHEYSKRDESVFP